MKWLKIRNVLKEMCGGREIEIMLSTELPGDLKSVVEFTNDTAVFYLNAQYAKTFEDVANIIGHEVAHVILGTDIHDEAFHSLAQTEKREFTERMGEHE